jgi:hypothetical protein
VSITSTLLNEVLDAARRGESLIAVGANKRPWFSWKRYQQHAADSAQLLSWGKDQRTTAFAVITGEISGFVVLDFDEQGVGLVEQHDLQPHVRTGRGGYHLRVQHPGFYVATQNSKVTKLIAARWPGLDIRGDGGYAIQYGATEHGGYEQLRDLSDLDPVSVLPDDMAAALGLLGADALDQLADEDFDSFRSSDGEKVHEGHRHRHLLEIASAMAGRGHTEDEILAELRRVNQAECLPPKDDSALVALARDVFKRYGTKPPPEDTANRVDLQQLETLLRLAQNGIHIHAVRLIGNGPSAGLEIDLSTGETIEAERCGDLWTHSGLAKFVTWSTGVNASGITKVEAGEANAIIRRLANTERATTIADLGCDHGVDFLTRAATEKINVNDQAERYQAWSRSQALDPVRASDLRTATFRDSNATIPATVADASLVLEHIDGRRLVRCDWLFAHVKRAGEVSHPAELARRMEHAGWTRRGKRGRIKATSPGLGPPIILPFWIVPPAWEESL